MDDNHIILTGSKLNLSMELHVAALSNSKLMFILMFIPRVAIILTEHCNFLALLQLTNDLSRFGILIHIKS